MRKLCDCGLVDITHRHDMSCEINKFDRSHLFVNCGYATHRNTRR